MEKLQKNPNSIFLFLFFLSSSLLNPTSSKFSPSDYHLINCGSDSSATVDNRVFLADTGSGSSVLFAPLSISAKDQNPPPDSPVLYHTARIFTRPSCYHFHLKARGPHLIRLHFFTFSSSDYKLSSANFHVSARGFSLLRDFKVPNRALVLKDYLMGVNEKNLGISFRPACSSCFAFISAIEVISAPDDLISDVAQLVDSSGVKDYGGLSKKVLESVYKINTGGKKVTPFNDSLWRTWIPDEDFLHLKSSGKSVYFSGRIKYQPGGATREIAPDNVYNTARIMNLPEVNVLKPNFNVTWIFPVSLGFRYLVRMHFCDIVSSALNQLYFNVYLNGILASKDLDLSTATNGLLASPYYIDFVVDPLVSGDVRVSIGPSSLSSTSTVNAILNGLEIMKIGNFGADSTRVAWPSENVSVFLRSILGGFVFICVLVFAYFLISSKWLVRRDSIGWSRLPIQSSDEGLKQSNPATSGNLSLAKK